MINIEISTVATAAIMRLANIEVSTEVIYK